MMEMATDGNDIHEHFRSVLGTEGWVYERWSYSLRTYNFMRMIE